MVHCTYKRHPLAPPALGSVKLSFRIPPACFGVALAIPSACNVSLWYYDTSYGKYTLTTLNLSYPFGYLGLFLGIALALMHYAAPMLCTILHMPYAAIQQLWLVSMVVTNSTTYTNG
jgi:hypothetical protein